MGKRVHALKDSFGPKSEEIEAVILQAFTAFEQELHPKEEPWPVKFNLYKNITDILLETQLDLQKGYERCLSQCSSISAVQYLPVSDHVLHLHQQIGPTLLEQTKLPESVILLITEYSLCLGFNTQIRSDEIYFSHANVACKRPHGPDCSTAIANFSINRRTKL